MRFVIVACLLCCSGCATQQEKVAVLATERSCAPRPDLRAVTLSVSSGQIHATIDAGSRVSILGTFTFPSTNSVVVGDVETKTVTLLQDVKVLQHVCSCG
jgi:hypothetical protein